MRGELAGVDLLEHVLDRAGHGQQLLLAARWRRRRAGRGRRSWVSSSVAANASTSWCGSLRMKPTVSVIRNVRPLQAQRARRRVERVEEPVADADLGAGQRVEQRRLARVGVARQRDGGQVRALALGALGRAGGLDLLEAALEDRDAVARQPAIGLDLRLARAAGADAAHAAAGAETLEVRPQAAHAGHVVFELGELDLHLALGRVRVAGEDVEDHRGAVEHRDVERGLEVALLARRQLVVGDDDVGVGRLEQRLELLDLARAEVEVRVRVVALLGELADRRDTGGPEELLELLEVLVFRRGRDAEGALLGPAGVWRRGVAGLGRAAVSRAFQGLPF